MVTLKFPDCDSWNEWARNCTKQGWQSSRCDRSINTVTIRSRLPSQLEKDAAEAVKFYGAKRVAFA